METSCQLLQIREEITSLTKEKEAIERRIKEKQYEEADLCKINLCFIKIIQKTKGADNYSPEKGGCQTVYTIKEEMLAAGITIHFFMSST